MQGDDCVTRSKSSVRVSCQLSNRLMLSLLGKNVDDRVAPNKRCWRISGIHQRLSSPGLSRQMIHLHKCVGLKGLACAISYKLRYIYQLGVSTYHINSLCALWLKLIVASAMCIAMSPDEMTCTDNTWLSILCWANRTPLGLNRRHDWFRLSEDEVTRYLLCKFFFLTSTQHNKSEPYLLPT